MATCDRGAVAGQANDLQGQHVMLRSCISTPKIPQQIMQSLCVHPLRISGESNDSDTDVWYVFGHAGRMDKTHSARELCSGPSWGSKASSGIATPFPGFGKQDAGRGPQQR
uniref:Uncharacterized protein n=1 Tax=Eutreptiella gymnastica TaxID=73025 RepID=A0A7S4G0I8_9EUGL